MTYRCTSWRAVTTRGARHQFRRFWATVNTRNVNWAGTDSPVEFTLYGVHGKLSSTLDRSCKGVLEAAETEFVAFEAMNIE
jgi:hypothetical protein